MAGSIRILGESWRAWVALAIGVITISGHTASSYTLAVLMKPILAEFDWLRSEFAFARFLRVGAMIFALAYAGKFTDRYGARIVFIVGAIIIGTGTVATAGMTSLAQFLAIMTFMGPGQACVGSVAASALILRQFSRHKGLAIGVLNGGDNLLSSTLPIAVTGIAGLYGWRVAVGSLGVGYFLLAALIFWALRPAEGRQGTADDNSSADRNVDAGQDASQDASQDGSQDGSQEARQEASLRELPWGDWRLWAIFTTYFMIYAFITALVLHLHAFITDLGYGREDASQIFSVLILVGAIGAPLFGWLSERIGALQTVLVLVVGLALNSVVLWSEPGLDTLMIWAATYGLVNSGVVAVLALTLMETFGPRQIGRLMGVTMMFCMAATMIGDVYTAMMFDWLGSYVPVWRSYTALMIVTLIPIAALLRRPKVIS